MTKFLWNGREVYINRKTNTVLLETPTKEEYARRLKDAGLVDYDKNSVGRCWYRAYTNGEECS